jgi:hypothetical protein
VKQDDEICSMATIGKFLIIGMVGGISAWDWKPIMATKNKNQPFKLLILFVLVQ